MVTEVNRLEIIFPYSVSVLPNVSEVLDCKHVVKIERRRNAGCRNEPFVEYTSVKYPLAGVPYFVANPIGLE